MLEIGLGTHRKMRRWKYEFESRFGHYILRAPPEKQGGPGVSFWAPPEKSGRAGVLFWAPPEKTSRAGVLF